MTQEYLAHIGERDITFSVNSPVFSSQSHSILSEQSPTSLKNQSWYKQGYCILDILSKEEHALMVLEAEHLICKTFNKLAIAYDAAFTLENYHRYIADDAMHSAFTRTTRDFDTADLTVFVDIIYQRLSEKLGIRFAKNDKTDHEILILRISRPNSYDMNPAHRDAYQDVWQQSLNIWYKLTGDDALSTLPVMPSSHLFPENTIERTETGCIMNGLRYNVPIITNTPNQLRFIRPTLKAGQVLIFSPFLIHGLGVNDGDVTRTAIELRPVVID